jgi:hypothetical protein
MRMVLISADLADLVEREGATTVFAEALSCG